MPLGFTPILTSLATATVLATSLTAATTLPANSGTPTADKAKEAKSLVIGIDGSTYGKFASTDLPNIKEQQARGTTSVSNLYTEPVAPTLSGPGWATIATGVWPDKHKVMDNEFTGNAFATYRDYLTRLETAHPSASTLVVGTWSPIADTVFSSAVDKRVQGGTDAGTTTKAVKQLLTGDPDSTFVHLDDVDHAGHEHGTGSPEYVAALKAADKRVGQLLRAVRNRPTYADEDWQIIITADHGHTVAGGHGGVTPPERQTYVIAEGRGFRAHAVRHDIKLTDIAPTVLRHHKVTREPFWHLDGTAATTIVPDDFDSLRGSLRSSADETSISSQVKGWTTKAPNGWSIDNARMPVGGVREWRGWSFATDQFWTAADRGQGRETNVRSRNVFAVADSDEWDDKSHRAGTFDSTLISPAYKVVGGKVATLRFVTTYAIDGPQSADVLVSYDGHAPKRVKSFTKASNGIQTLKLKVPAGASKAKVHFHYTGTNSAFWTIDQVSLKPVR